MKTGYTTNKEEEFPYWASPDVIFAKGVWLTMEDENATERRNREVENWMLERYGPPGYGPTFLWVRLNNRFWFKREEDFMMFLLRWS